MTHLLVGVLAGSTALVCTTRRPMRHTQMCMSPRSSRSLISSYPQQQGCTTATCYHPTGPSSGFTSLACKERQPNWFLLADRERGAMYKSKVHSETWCSNKYIWKGVAW